MIPGSVFSAENNININSNTNTEKTEPEVNVMETALFLNANQLANSKHRVEVDRQRKVVEFLMGMIVSPKSRI